MPTLGFHKKIELNLWPLEISFFKSTALIVVVFHAKSCHRVFLKCCVVEVWSYFQSLSRFWVHNIPCVLKTAVPTIQSSRHRGRAGPHIAHWSTVTQYHIQAAAANTKHHQRVQSSKLQQKTSMKEEAVMQMYPLSAVQCCDLLSCCWSAQS